MNLSILGWRLSAKWAFSAGLVVCVPGAFAQASISVEGTKLNYISVFRQYQGLSEQLSDQPVLSWREANTTVDKIGGWRAYAREAKLPEHAEKTNTSSGKAEMHGDHGSKR